MLNYATLNLDTHKVVKLLQERGYSEESAEGFIEAIQEITLTGVATKQDIYELQAATTKNIDALRAATKDDMHELQAATVARIEDLRTETRKDIMDIRQDIADIRGKFSVMQWAIGIHMAMTVGILFKLFS